jgi:hypothetical protein
MPHKYVQMLCVNRIFRKGKQQQKLNLIESWLVRQGDNNELILK